MAIPPSSRGVQRRSDPALACAAAASSGSRRCRSRCPARGRGAAGGRGAHFPARAVEFKALREISPPRRRSAVRASARDGRLCNAGDLTVKPGRQAASTNVKFRQAMSSFVKPLLDGAVCTFNASRGMSLTTGLRRKHRPQKPDRRQAHERRITRDWPLAKKMSLECGREATRRRRQCGGGGGAVPGAKACWAKKSPN